MPMLDVFRGDAYGVVELTTAINKLPFVPSKLKQLGLFKESGVRTTSVAVEERQGRIYLLPTSARGTSGIVGSGPKRKVRSFQVPHIQLNEAVLADDVQNVRAFGTDDDMEAVNDLVNTKLESMRQSVEYTHEWYRIGAIQGIVYDSDGTTVIYDWFQEFGLTETAISVDVAAATPVNNHLKAVAATAYRTIEDMLGMAPFTSLVAICGAGFYDAVTQSLEVRDAYNRWQEGKYKRDAQVRSEFEYGGITWIEYRGKIGATPFIPDLQARVIPLGVPDLFATNFAPADYIETVNTIGKPVYAKQEVQKFDKGIEIEVQSNPLMICTRPGVLIKLTITGS